MIYNTYFKILFTAVISLFIGCGETSSRSTAENSTTSPPPTEATSGGGANTGAVTTVAGNIVTVGITDGIGNPINTVLDSSGNIYVVDKNNHIIRKITSGGTVIVLAGSIGTAGSADGTGTNASFNAPSGIAIDSSGNLYVTDTGNQLIRKITSSGIVTTLAGTVGVAGSTNGTGTAASFNSPFGVAVDSSGNLYVTDLGNHLIRKMTPATVVTTFAGTDGVTGSVDDTGTAASFNSPSGISIDSSNNLYIADQGNHLIRKITSSAVVTTFAGTGGPGSVDDTGTAASFNSPSGVAVDSSSGNLYVADTHNNLIRKITSAGVVTTLAGATGIAGQPTDGTGAAARFSSPSGVAVDSSGNLYVADAGQLIRKITSSGVVTTAAGRFGTSGSTDGTGTAASFANPSGIAVDSSGNLYITDTGNYLIRKITSAGVVTTFAGTVGVSGSTDGTGTAASFNNPFGISIDSSNNLYIVDQSNHLIRKITPSAVVTTFAGTVGVAGSTNGTGTAASFESPYGITIDSSGNLYVADTRNHLIRKITSAGVVTTLAGTVGVSGSTNGTGTAASFGAPQGIGVDSSGNVYVADTDNNLIRKITSAGVVTTFAGTVGVAGSTNGTGTAARFNNPQRIVVDSSDNVYVADSGNHLVRKITSAGVVTTLAGSDKRPGSTDATGTAASFFTPMGLGVDSSGNLYVADFENHLIRKIQ